MTNTQPRPGRQSDRTLYDRSVETLVASWAYFATGSPGARVVRAPSAAIALFTHAPDREIFNNAILARDIAVDDLALNLDAVASTYADARVERYALWIHESQQLVAEHLRTAGFAHDETTRTMVAALDALPAVDTFELQLLAPDYDAFLRINGLPADLFPDLPDGGRIYLAAADGQPAATLMTFDHDGDCGIYNVATLEFARGRGLATALTARALLDARERGCTTASLQSTEMAEGVYRAAGFRDLGCFHEYVRATDAA